LKSSGCTEKREKFATAVVYGDIVREVRQAILSIPARIHGDLPHMVPSEVEVIKRQCRETLAELKRLGGKPPRVEAGAHRHAKRVF
jgi:phage terminase Nu1 subunit (DNA packaging protein)